MIQVARQNNAKKESVKRIFKYSLLLLAVFCMFKVLICFLKSCYKIIVFQLLIFKVAIRIVSYLKCAKHLIFDSLAHTHFHYISNSSLKRMFKYDILQSV